MINIQVSFLALIGIVIMGCAVTPLPEYVATPEPPLEWKVELETQVGCPNITGQYESTPSVADLKQDGLWRVSKGNWYDYLLLIPFNRVTAVKRTLADDLPEFPRDSLIFELDQQGDTLRVVSPDHNNEGFATHLFSRSENDFTCKAGNLIFPEFKIQGGTEGSVLNGKTYRQATITAGGDLLLYEQTQSHKTIHKYFLFKSNEIHDRAG